MTLNPRQSKMATEQILNHLCPDSNSVNSLMTGNSSDRVSFLASKISDQIKVLIQNLNNLIKPHLLFASLSQLTYNDILQNEKTRLPATFSSLKPDYSHISVAENSDKPEDWLLHPIGYVFQFDAQKEWIF